MWVTRPAARRQRLLDINRGELDDLRARLGVEEHRLDAHLEALDSVERAIAGGQQTPQRPRSITTSTRTTTSRSSHSIRSTSLFCRSAAA